MSRKQTLDCAAEVHVRDCGAVLINEQIFGGLRDTPVQTTIIYVNR